MLGADLRLPLGEGWGEGLQRPTAPGSHLSLGIALLAQKGERQLVFDEVVGYLTQKKFIRVALLDPHPNPSQKGEGEKTKQIFLEPTP